MLDIVPAGDFESKKQASQRRKSPHVVEVDWKLPARLRKPLKKKMGFQAKALYRDAARPVKGLEAHTGDFVAPVERPLRISMPPHTGSFVKGKPISQLRRVRKKPITRTISRKETLRGERDVAWRPPTLTSPPAETDDLFVTVEKPQRAFSVPQFRLPRLPRFHIPAFRMVVAPVFVLFIFVVLGVSVWGGMRAYGVRDSVLSQALEARGSLVLAQEALAQNNFAASEVAFVAASEDLSRAREELAEALGGSAFALRWLDVTGTVRSGEDLLVAAESVAEAGQAMSRAAATLFAVDPEKERSLIEGIENARVELATAEDLLIEAEDRLGSVGSPLLPDELQNQVAEMEKRIPETRKLVSLFLSNSDSLLALLGADRERQYLLLFQNNHEIRPTGGFIGSLGLVNVDHGVVENINVQTVYDPDGQLRDVIEPPIPLQPLTDRWYLRDANWFVDFGVSAEAIQDFFEKEGGPTVDGIVALTPVVTQEILRVVGAVEMPQYDVTVTAENFVEVTQDEVTYSYDREVNRPKQFMADLAPILMSRVVGATGEQRAELMGVLGNLLRQKHLLLHVKDDALQEQIEAAGWGGTVPSGEIGFVHVNNANIGGHKSDQFIEQEIDYRLEVEENGDAIVVLTIRRDHRGPLEVGGREFPIDENPARHTNVVWQRVLVPSGSVLLDAQGFADASDVPHPFVSEGLQQAEPDPRVAGWQTGQTVDTTGTIVGEEAGYTMFGNWQITRPGETTVALYTYRLPQKFDLPSWWKRTSRGNIFVLKQPGDTRTTARVEVRVPHGVGIRLDEPIPGVTQNEQNVLVYRGALDEDFSLGAIFHNL